MALVLLKDLVVIISIVVLLVIFGFLLHTLGFIRLIYAFAPGVDLLLLKRVLALALLFVNINTSLSWAEKKKIYFLKNLKATDDLIFLVK